MQQNSLRENDLHVQDRAYFVGIVRSTIFKLESEIHRLRREAHSFIENNKEYVTLSKTTKDLSQQIEDSRNEFENYNMARMNSFRDVTEIQKEIDDLHAHNQQLQLTVNEIYREKQSREARIQQLVNVVFDDQPHDIDVRENNQSQSTSNKLPTEISTLESQLNKIREQVSSSIIHQEALSLIDQISDLEWQHFQLLELTTQIEEDNQELESIEKQIRELEQHHDDSVGNDDQLQAQYSNDIKHIQKTNLTLLSFISRTLGEENSIRLKMNLEQYNHEKQKSNETLIILAEQHRKLKQDCIKLERLDQKLGEELHQLKQQYANMQTDLDKFNDLESLKRQAQRRKQQLTTDKINMIKRREITQLEIQTLQTQFETIQTQLQNHQTHQQLVTLQQRLQTISQTLFVLDEGLISANIQSQYEQIKHQALELVYAHNQWLIERLKHLS